MGRARLVQSGVTVEVELHVEKSKNALAMYGKDSSYAYEFNF